MISIIIPAFNSEKTIKRCINSLLKQSLPKKMFEIIVVDDGSKDKTIQIAKESGADKVLASEHLSSGKARNIGVKNAQGNLIAFIDSDCKAKKDWLVIIQKELQHCDGITGPLLNGNNNIVSWAEYLIEFSDFNENTPRSHIKFGAGGNQAYKKSDFLSTSGFLEDQTHSEDVQFGKSFHDSGKTITFVPELQVYHYGRRKFRPFLQNMKRFGKRSFQDSMIKSSNYSKFTKSKWSIPVLFVFKIGARFRSAVKAKKIFMFLICLPVIIGGVLMFSKGFLSEFSNEET